MSSVTPVFLLQNVSKKFGDVEVLPPLDITIAKGEILVLLGPSGCGKSTLLRLLIGLLTPSAGKIFFEGSILDQNNVLTLRQKMGYVIQEGGLFPHLSAYENITLMGKYLGWDPSRMKNRVEELALLTHFPPDGFSRFPTQLSGGQRQRVGLMRALMLDPDVLLLDEPFGALDPLIRSDLQTNCKHIMQTLQKTVVMVTHDIGEAAYFGTTVLFMHDGHIIQRGTMASLVRNPTNRFVAQFISAQRTLILEDILEASKHAQL